MDKFTSIMYRSNRIVLTGALSLTMLASFVFITPEAFAHQRGLYTIGGKDYLIVIGSQNEPVFVDDKSGVDLFVYTPNPNDPMNSRANGTQPVTGLEKTLKVGLLAGSKNETLSLTPAFRDPGHYNAPFYPTVATTFNYTIKGTINNTPVNISFMCLPTGEAGASANNNTVTLSNGVMRKAIAGGFGCPQARSSAGFPEQYTSNVDMSTALKQLQTDVSSIKSTVSSSPTTTTTTTTPAGNSGSSSNTSMMSYAGIGTGIVGIGIAIGAIVMTSRKKNG